MLYQFMQPKDFRGRVTPRVTRVVVFLAASYVGICGVMPAQSTYAQMFGSRTVGRTLSPQARPGGGPTAADATGMVRNQRFVRGNRNAASFVGSDRADVNRFVGSLQAGSASAIQSAASGVQAAADESTQVNRPARRPGANEPYAPRLAVGFNYDTTPNEQIVSRLTQQLESHGFPIEVSVEDRTAILRGEVASEEQQELAKLLAGFEPGISSVRSELTVGPSQEEPLPMPRNRRQGGPKVPTTPPSPESPFLSTPLPPTIPQPSRSP